MGKTRQKPTAEAIGVKGGKPLEKWLKANDATQEQLAAALGVKQQAVSSWICGRTRPKDEEIRISIELFTRGGVKRALWLTDLERERRVSLTRQFKRTGTEE